MNKPKNAAFQSKRNDRKRFCKLTKRSFGLEYLEKRNVFASDLNPFLSDGDGDVLFESPLEETRSSSSVPRSIEVANSPLSVMGGDIIRFEVPASILLQLTDRDSYQLQVFYSENYFFDEPNGLNFGAADLLIDQSGIHEQHTDKAIPNYSALGNSTLRVLSDSKNSSSEHIVPNATLLDNNNSASEFAILLASLTASSNFDGYMRILDWVQDPSLRNSNPAIEGLPKEVRIEPRVTFPTALQDPGATVVKTIVVNRAPHGLMVSTEKDRVESPANDGTENDEIANVNHVENSSDASATADSNEQHLPVVTLKTIDISLARRNEPSRSWMRSSSIPNPGIQRESASRQTTSESTIVASPPTVDSEAESSKPTRRELHVPGTKLQPVEFLLADSIVENDDIHAIESGRIQAIDQAISYYLEDESEETSGAIELLPATWLTASKSMSRRLVVEENRPSDWNQNEKVLHAHLEALYISSIYGGVASNKDSWKNAVRSASDSVVGQAMLASLTTLAVQHRDINAFGTKSAWEFVTKTTPISPV